MRGVGATVATVAAVTKRRDLERWQERFKVPTDEFVNILAAADRLGVRMERVSIWLYTERLRRAYLISGEEGLQRASLEAFVAWRESASFGAKVRHAFGTFVRLM